MPSARIVLLLILVLPLPLYGVTLTIGNDITTPNSSDGNIAAIRTDIDLVHPASCFTYKHLQWSTGFSRSYLRRPTG